MDTTNQRGPLCRTTKNRRTSHRTLAQGCKTTSGGASARTSYEARRSSGYLVFLWALLDVDEQRIPIDGRWTSNSSGCSSGRFGVFIFAISPLNSFFTLKTGVFTAFDKIVRTLTGAAGFPAVR